MAPSLASIAASGRPTTSERLKTTATLPSSWWPTGRVRSYAPRYSMILITASGVHGSTHFLPASLSIVRMLWYSEYR